MVMKACRIEEMLKRGRANAPAYSILLAEKNQEITLTSEDTGGFAGDTGKICSHIPEILF